MTRFLAKATSALSITLLLVQPGQLAAQGMIAPSRAKLAAPPGLDGLLRVQQTCAGDPTLPDCIAVPPSAEVASEAPPVDAPVVAPEAPGAIPAETAPAAVPGPPPAEAPEVAPETVPEAVPAETAPETPAAQAPAAVPDVPQPEATPEPVAPGVAPPLAPADEAAPAEAPAAAPQAPSAGTVEPVAPEAAPSAEPAAPQDPVTLPEAAVPTDPVEPSAVTEPTAEPAAADVPAGPAEVAPVAAPLPAPTPEQAQTLETLLTDPGVAAAVATLAQTTAAPADAAGAPAAGDALSALAAGVIAPDAANTVTRTLSAADTRSPAQDFTSALTTTAPSQVEDKDDGLTDLQKAGLIALGIVVVGMLINRNRVVANSGDRVVVDRGNGDLAIWKDDDAILRAPGVVETRQRFDDGSTLTVLDRPDGSRIITVRDATGRVLRRDRVDVNGRRTPIIDDTRYYEPVEVSRLPQPRLRGLRFVDGTDPAMIRALLDEAEQPDLGRSFSLAQVRDIRQLRTLAPELTTDPVTFASGSSAISPQQAGRLARLGELMQGMIADNPRELFLIEGHTDAVGSAAFNLALSDRRAESVALALSSIFGVPPENMVVQGYGESELKVATTADEPQNRRVALRRITWLVEDPA
ncbi:MAG: OmpA family protein [Rhodobacter sp.]|nr:OmpA family protein [Rhodobacter sp.]MCA3461838.1 OmpA family protein [Rhodobacter sp.]MCA3465124.1 OmpA family protein [Rhodobacter sp.]MCA3468605.1 OmpA family protein [Rhodobacter sp.]MCA3472412.1 OmpA family protein [Rhodobacter sp.]